MESTEQKLDLLFASVRRLEAENLALKNFITAMYAQEGDVNNTMKHFMGVVREIETHNTYSTLPEDFLTSYLESVKAIGQEARVALQRAPEMRAKT